MSKRDEKFHTQTFLLEKLWAVSEHRPLCWQGPRVIIIVTVIIITD